MEYKNCPFCGSDRITSYCRGRTKQPYGRFVYAKCDVCGAQTGLVNLELPYDCSKCVKNELCESAEEANKTVVAKWNMRADE